MSNQNLIRELYTDRDRIMIDRFKSEGVEEYKASMHILNNNIDHRLQKSLLESLDRRYDQAIVYISKIRQPNLALTPLLPLDVINAGLKQIAESMIYTMSMRTDVQMDSIKDYLNTDNLTMTYYELISDKVAYGVLTMAAQHLLGMLSYYVDKLYLFHYIRDHIIKPNLYNMINQYKKDTLQKDQQQDNSTRSTTCYNLLNSFIYAVMISMDTKLASRLLNELTEYTTEIGNIFPNILMKSDYLIPKLFRDLLLTNSTNQLSDFLTAYSTTFTREATLELMKQYCDQTPDFIMKFNKTYNDRIDMNPIIKISVDGLTLSENYIVQKLIQLKPTTEEEDTIIKKSYLLSNILSIINEYRSQPNVRITINNSEIKIVSDICSERVFAYRRKEIKEIFNNPLNLFKTNKSTIERLYEENNLNCPLFQSAIPEKVYKKLGIDQHLTKQYSLDTVEKRVKHRQDLIKQLQNELLSVNPELIQKSNNLISGNIDKIQYINTSQRSNYIYRSTEKSAILLTLSETEGIYQLMQKYNQNNTNTQKIIEKETPQSNTQDVQFDMLKQALTSLTNNNGVGNLNYVNLRNKLIY